MTLSSLSPERNSCWPENPVQSFINELSDDQMRMLWSYLSLASERDRGAMNELAGIYGSSFWDFVERLESFRRKYRCSPEVIKGAFSETLRGFHVSDAMLRAYELPRPKRQQQVVSETRQEVKKTGIGGWLGRLLGRRN